MLLDPPPNVSSALAAYNASANASALSPAPSDASAAPSATRTPSFRCPL